MSVLILFSSTNIGGAEMSISRMVIASKRIKYIIGSINHEGPLIKWMRNEGIQTKIFTKNEGPLQILRGIFNLSKYLRITSIQVVYVFGAKLSIFIRILKFFHPKLKIVQAIRWNPASNSNLDKFTRFMELTTSSLVNSWITNSFIAKKNLVKMCGINANSINVIYNGLDTKPLKINYYENRPLEILTVANFSPRKGHIEYLRSIKIVTQVIPKAKFVFIGRDDMKGLIQRRITELNLDKNVKCIGFKSDLTKWYKRARVFVLPSLWDEGCPTSILEAFSFGIPVIASNIDGIPELIDNDVDGYLIDPYSNNISKYVIELLRDKIKAKRMGINGARKINAKFTLKECCNKHLNVFSELIE